MRKELLCALVSAACLTSCAIPLERVDWCVVKGGVRVSVPLDRGVEYQKEKCKSKEIFQRIFN